MSSSREFPHLRYDKVIHFSKIKSNICKKATILPVDLNLKEESYYQKISNLLSTNILSIVLSLKIFMLNAKPQTITSNGI